MTIHAGNVRVEDANGFGVFCLRCLSKTLCKQTGPNLVSLASRPEYAPPMLKPAYCSIDDLLRRSTKIQLYRFLMILLFAETMIIPHGIRDFLNDAQGVTCLG